MSTTVFGVEDYKVYLRSKIKENAQRTGYKALLARAAGVPQALISQVIHGKTHFSLDHGLKLSRFWHFSDNETEHWLELIQLARAASPELRKHLLDRIAERRKEREDIGSRLNQPRIGASEHELEYYTNWIVQAAHMAVTIPKYQAPQNIASSFHVPLQVISEVMQRLEAMGLVARSPDGSWKPMQKQIHLPKTSLVSPINHWMWRQKAMEKAYQSSESDLFYSTLHTLSIEDARRIRTMLLDTISSISTVVGPSKEEALVGLNVDFFALA